MGEAEWAQAWYAEGVGVCAWGGLGVLYVRVEMHALQELAHACI